MNLPVEPIAKRIRFFHGREVLLDSDLAQFYGVATETLRQSVARNKERFPEDFMFQLTAKEAELLRKGGNNYLPHVFTEEGVVMLSSILHSKRAVQISVAIMRTLMGP